MGGRCSNRSSNSARCPGQSVGFSQAAQIPTLHGMKALWNRIKHWLGLDVEEEPLLPEPPDVAKPFDNEP